ncbi:hypothetical protein SE17_11380 [Kouleothrix aurantiaca]|uniref:Uncharacterized protein n=1 Tax=Kouleothrix aurantiaca TaxID=186479 RepID=A0A0P9D5L6_9CHLR|nr:hypothetical protein SE17_11380 [Kouleothrix aurantiaca]
MMKNSFVTMTWLRVPTCAEANCPHGERWLFVECISFLARDNQQIKMLWILYFLIAKIYMA